ncbi:MAG TPA: HAMP domain-containing sensor histidine kinase [Williamwhitmania sp.]|nr:HAMP domain-containing sensor histidine kinase [Williamwhitmania sp.]
MIKFYSKKFRIKILILFVLTIIAISSLWVTRDLVHSLAAEEKKKIDLWATATEELANQQEENKDFSFIFRVLEENNTVPVVLTTQKREIVAFRNVDSSKISTPNRAKQLLSIMEKNHKPIVVKLPNNETNLVFYEDSNILKKLYYFPIVQLSVLFLFILAAYIAFSSIRNSEQNLVWVGLAKETAHQLGTPTSSLLAWLEVLKNQDIPPAYLDELEKDIHRLEKITDRFSKIGSAPSLKPVNLVEQINQIINYLDKRVSSNITFIKEYNAVDEIYININDSLFEWVIENIVKNAIDAMHGKGTISFKVRDDIQVAYVDITDQGKGIPKKIAKTIFKPGFTTKVRGWGLGLSLSKRIIEDYHKGKIFVLNSDAVRGTTFRIVLKK